MRKLTASTGLSAALLTLIAGTNPARGQDTARPAHNPIVVHERHGKDVTSGNWSGYAVTGAKGSVTDVKASWVVPAIQGTCPATAQYASFWVGIDGFTSNTVEQIGTDSDCVNGAPVYYAWYEFYPHFSYTIGVAVKPNDIVSAEVKATGKGEFTVTLTNETTTATFSHSEKVPSANQVSAEWVAEAPYSGGVLPLADFNTVTFGSDYTAQPITCFATIGNVTGPIGTTSFSPNTYDITMDTSSGVIKAKPSVLSTDGTSFSIAWLNAGP